MSKFDKIFEARETENPAPKPSNILKTKNSNITGKNKNDPQKTAVNNSQADDTVKENTRRRGRPPAKRSDPDYVGFTTYIRKNTHLKVKISLLQEGKGRELSELVETLLSDWANKK